MVRHEEGVELAALERLGKLQEMPEIEVGVEKGARERQAPVWIVVGRMNAPSFICRCEAI